MELKCQYSQPNCRHICNSHEPLLKPKIAKEPPMPTLTEKDWQTFRKMTEMNKAQQVTRGHKTLGAKWLFEIRFSHQSSLYLDSEVAPKSPTFHTAIRSFAIRFASCE